MLDEYRKKGISLGKSAFFTELKTEPPYLFYQAFLAGCHQPLRTRLRKFKSRILERTESSKVLEVVQLCMATEGIVYLSFDIHSVFIFLMLSSERVIQ